MTEKIVYKYGAEVLKVVANIEIMCLGNSLSTGAI
jgi:hypothetical protein